MTAFQIWKRDTFVPHCSISIFYPTGVIFLVSYFIIHGKVSVTVVVAFVFTNVLICFLLGS